MRFTGIRWFFLIWALTASTAFGQSQDQEFYERGKQAAQQGNVQEALDIWLQARGALQVPSTKIGNAFIELVAKENRRDYYEFGTLMYQWGLSAETIEPNKEVLRNEIERVGLLAEDDVYRRWIRLWKDNDPRLYQELLTFWEQQDPTPTTTYNERLIEHWQRIAYSKEHFTQNKSGPLSADDRARIYIRYGPPDVQRSGMINFDPGMASSYIQEIANTPTLPEPKVGGSIVQAFVRQARNFHTSPQYEVWVYRASSTRPEKIIFMFGNSSETAGFEEIDSVEELIPARAFSMSQGMVPTGTQFSSLSPRVRNIRPGLILQIMYYDELATVDSYFGNMFNTITDRAIESNAQPVSVGLGQEMLTQAKFDLQSLQRKAPREVSTYGQQMVDIPVEVFQYRLLDQNNQPYFATFVESRPQKAFWFDYLSNYSEQDSSGRRSLDKQEFEQYNYTQSVQLYQNGKLQNQISANPLIVTESGDASLSLIAIPAMGEGTRQVFTAKLENTDPQSSYPVENLPFKPEVRGLGKTVVPQPAPLESMPNQLQMGELILGYNYDTSAPLDEQFPFTVANRKQIPQNEDLVIHFEVYNMSQNEEGIYNARLSYQVEPKGGILDWFKKQRENLTLTLNLEASSPRYIENLQVQTRELRPGIYNMQLTVEDPQNGQMVERNFEFEVIENPGASN